MPGFRFRVSECSDALRGEWRPFLVMVSDNYAKDKMVPTLAKGTTLHLILVQYRGPKMANCELVGESRL